jgi:hypothetical protein
MSGGGLSTMSVDELLDVFEQLGTALGVAMDLCKASEATRLNKKIGKVDDELQRRSGDQRIALTRLFAHPNPYVRYAAATCLIRLVPVEARRHLQLIADSKWYPLAGHAGMYLHNLDSGFFVRSKVRGT